MLLNNISKYKHVIENKKTDAVSSNQKKVTKQKITDLFNSASPESVPCSMDGLKKLYDNKKRDLRKLKAEEKKEIILTGGGPPPNPPADPNADLLMGILDLLSVTGDCNEYDSDSICVLKKQEQDNTFTLEIGDSEILPEMPKEVLEDIETELSDMPNIDVQENDDINQTESEPSTSQGSPKNWKKYSVKDITKPASCVLQRNVPGKKSLPNKRKCETPERRRPTSTSVRALSSSILAGKYNMLVDKKQTLVEYKLKKLKTDMEHANEIHQLQCKALKLDILLKERQSINK